MPWRGAGALGVALACLAAASLPATANAAPEPGDYQENDHLGFRNVLPPGTNGHADLIELAAFLTLGQRPVHNNDQFDMYADLVYEDPGALGEAQVNEYFKDASFGVSPSDRERVYSPRGDVTVVRDEGFGVPHIYGETRRGAMFGAGYVSAEDRLFFMDVLRHAGRGEVSSFIGGGQRAMDHDVWSDAPYRESELQLQFELGDDLYGQAGAQLQVDVQDYVAGVNAYITEACNVLNLTKMPGEYAAILKPNYPCSNPWKVTDVIATASLVAGIFGKGGGNEVGSALLLEDARERFGKRKGKRVWHDFRSAHDPERPTTVRGKRFPYEKVPRKVRGRALPDPGTTQKEPLIAGEAPAPAREKGSAEIPPGLEDYPEVGDLLEALRTHDGASNALLVSARESQGGHPVAVMGPQVSYFSPQILMEFGIHAPASADGPPLDAQGAAFLGTNLYVQLGRGRDYAWSATSAGQDIIDTFAVPLCETNGADPTIESMAYRYRGECKPFDVLERSNSWSPNLADSTPAGSETLRALRSEVGIVTHRALINGRPFAYTRLRVTYFHEVDSALGFADFNNPERMESPAEFQRAACKVDLTFNWFYTDDRHIAYFNSGGNPVRGKQVDPNFPARAKRPFEWRGWQPFDGEGGLATSDRLPCAQRPQVVDQRYLTSWNNAQAPGYRAADDNFAYQSVYRNSPLDERIKREINGPGKISLGELVGAMEDAGTVDLRGDQVLPRVLRIVQRRPVSDPALAEAIETLRAWSRSGAHRRDMDGDGTYEDAAAVQIMDAWWPLLVEAQFKPTLGEGVFDRVRSMVGLDDSPHKSGANQGSAYNGGWYGYVEKDLRTLLGKKVLGRYSRVYCGRGKLGRCRRALLDSLAAAIAIPYEEVYADADACDGGDPQWCFDAVESTATGGITQPAFHWINRPTFQQAVEVQGHRP